MAATFPAVLTELSEVDVYEASDDEIDYEPYDDFMDADETKDWLHAWTGNAELTGAEYLVFGQDGTGGYACFWEKEKDTPLEERPIVFFGSEGELGVVANNLSDFIWLLAQGIGPMEAVEYGADDPTDIDDLVAIAEEHFPDGRRPAAEILAEAQARHGGFKKMVEDLVAY